MPSSNDVLYLARTTHRNSRQLFGIRAADRRSHVYVCGKTGTGKSHLLGVMLTQDIARGNGCVLLDPHGQLARELRDAIPAERAGDVIFVDPSDSTQPWRFNPLAHVRPGMEALAAANLIEVFKKLWTDLWGPRLEHLLRNVVFTLLENEGSTLADIPPLLNDRTFRETLVASIANPVVADFWAEEYERYTPAFRGVVTAPLQNKMGALLTDPVTRRFLTDPGTELDLRKTIDDGKILIVSLDKGRIGEGPAGLIGSVLLSGIAVAGLSRTDILERDRRDVWVYADEFQTFTTLAVAGMLSELRKYRVGLILGNQHLSQLEPEVRDAVFGNVGTILSFRVGASDAAYLAKEFAPVFSATDFLQLERHHIYVRLLIDGQPSHPFSAETLDRAP